jgi:hypothetical protein
MLDFDLVRVTRTINILLPGGVEAPAAHGAAIEHGARMRAADRDAQHRARRPEWHRRRIDQRDRHVRHRRASLHVQLAADAQTPVDARAEASQREAARDCGINIRPIDCWFCSSLLPSALNGARGFYATRNGFVLAARQRHSDRRERARDASIESQLSIAV